MARAYQAVTAEITSATATGVKENLTLWLPPNSKSEVAIMEIGVNVRVVQTAGTFGWELQLISAENAAPGGTAVTPQPLAYGDRASIVTARTVVTGAPTPAGQVFQRAVFPLPAAVSPFVQPEGTILFRAKEPNEAIVLSSTGMTGSGIRVTQNIAATLTTAPVFTVYARWLELP